MTPVEQAARPPQPAGQRQGKRAGGRPSPPTSTPSISETQLVIAAAIPVLAAIVIYLPALRNGFIWDDPLVLQQLRAMRSIGDLIVPPPIVPRFYYRPLIFVSYLFDQALGGETPFWLHASVIGWHGLNTLLVFLLARRLFPGEWLIASGGALLFAVFPVHVESVAWMAGRSDVIVCTLMLLTVFIFMEAAPAWLPWIGGGVFLLAMLSKEMAIALVVLIPLLDLMRAIRPSWVRYAPLFLATLVYFVLRSHALGAFVGGLPVDTPVMQLATALVRALGFYTVRAVVPVGLCAYIPNVPPGAGYFLVGALVPVLAAGLIGLAWQRGRWQPAFLALWFFATLAPSLTVIVRRSASAVVADRYLYVPSVASCLLMAWVVVRLAQSRRVAALWPAVGIGALATLFTVLAVPYTRVWADNLAFWTDVAAKVPDEALPQRELARALLDHNRPDEAERALQRALALESSPEGRVMAYGNLGNLYRRQGRYDDSLRAFEEGLKIAPHPILYHNLGMTLMLKVQQEQQQGDSQAVLRDITRARDAFEQALKLGTAPGAPLAFQQDWDPAKTHALLGQVLFSMGDRAGARQHLEEALRLQPTGPVADLTREYMQNLPP